jgi:hypothetical protein
LTAHIPEIATAKRQIDKRTHPMPSPFPLPEEKISLPSGRRGGRPIASGGLDVGLRKIAALEHQGSPQMPCAGIGKAVPETEARLVPALPNGSYASSATRTVSGGTATTTIPISGEISFDRFCGGAYRKD